MLVFLGEARAQEVGIGAGLSVSVGREVRPGAEVGLAVRWQLCPPGGLCDTVAWYDDLAVPQRRGEVGVRVRARWEGAARWGVLALAEGGLLQVPTERSATIAGFAAVDLGASWRRDGGWGAAAGASFELAGAQVETWSCYGQRIVDIERNPLGATVGVHAMLDREGFGGLASGAAAWLPQTMLAEGFCMGRPLRVAEGVAEPLVAVRGTPDPVAGRWLRDGRAELASVTTFRRLALELVALAAPDALVTRAIHAAREEACHAALCFDLAARRCGRVAALALPAQPRAFPTRRSALAALVAEACVDGLVGEQAAAEAAATEADAARDDREARVLARIADEEREHAAFARDLVAWGLRVDTGRVVNRT